MSRIQYGSIPIIITNSLPPLAILGESCATYSCASGYFCNASLVCQQSIVVNISALQGVAAPVIGAAPVATITETAQYTGTVTWSPANNPFAGGTIYTATIALTPKAGYTLTGVPANFFTVAGATTTANAINSGVVTAVFPVTTLTIGMSYQGGIIFYIDGTGQHGLIAALSDQLNMPRGWGLQWYNGVSYHGYYPQGPWTVTFASGTAIGTGMANTNAIVAAQGAPILTEYAARLARNYNGGGYSDWYLPSKDELNQFYLNQAAVGGFYSECRDFWSSSEIDSYADWYGNGTSTWVSYSAWSQCMSGYCAGTQYNYLDKSEERCVRPIRTF
ncbi:MAG: hypothetical protein NTX79_01380 [Candidatus Micrarchaeota archaeon]|nr:hypothetical protein [Candidatus Micrarchaeota archaeon]